MNKVYYRLTETSDPEERLEDAALWKALHDRLESRIHLVNSKDDAPEDGLFLGRGRRGEMNENILGSPALPYWEDPAFISRCTRNASLVDIDNAMTEARYLLESGNPVFLKSTLPKHYARLFTDLEDFEEEMRGMVYSFIDRGPCLLVQEGVDMHYERRFLIMDGEVVTQSPVAEHLTPMSRSWSREASHGLEIEDIHFWTPKVRTGVFDPELTSRMTEMAEQIARDSDHDHLCVDLCVLGDDRSGPIEPIEWNPMQPGAVGLFACDPAKIAEAVDRHLEMNPGKYPGAQDEVDMRDDSRMTAADLDEILTDEDLLDVEFEDDPSP